MKRLSITLSVLLSIFLTVGVCPATDKPGTGQFLDISGLPFHGPEKAPVTIVVFTDYL